MSIQIQKILENFPELLTLARGSGTAEVRDLQAATTAKPDSLIFVGNTQHLKEALDSPSQHWVVAKDLESSVPERVATVLTSPNCTLAMALAAKRLFPQTKNYRVMGENIHPRAIVSPSARVGARCIIGPGAVIGDDSVIGEDCVIGSNAVIEAGVKIGARSHIHPLAFIGHSCELGEDCEVMPHTTIGGEGFGYAQDKAFNHYRITHYGRVILEDRVHIGSGVQIDRGTFADSRIGAGTKIDNHCHFGHNIQVGKNTLITGGMITAGSTTIGSYCVFGGRTTIKGHLQIGDKVQMGALSGITKSILEPGEYAGFPVQSLKRDMRVRAAIKNLPDLAKNVRRILKHLGLESDTTAEPER